MTSTSARRPVRAVLVSTALATLLLAGCTADAHEPDASAPTSTSAAPTSTSEAAPSTSEAPVEVETSTSAEPCPYLTEEEVSQTVGQMILAVEVTTTTPPVGPLPGCSFETYGEEVAVAIETRTIEPGTGLEQAVEIVPDGNPVDVGEGGSVLVHQGGAQTDIAAFAGEVLVTITINQESSLEATALAELVLAAAA